MKLPILLLILSMMTVTVVQAEGLQNIGTYQQNSAVRLYQVCDTCTSMNLTLVRVSATQAPLVTAQTMTQSGNEWYYNLAGTYTGTLGTYTYCYEFELSDSTTGNGCLTFIIDSQEETVDKGITEASIFLLLAMILSITMYLMKSRIIGGMGIFVSGFGILFRIPQQGWIGWIIIATGISMITVGLLEKPSRRYGR